MRYDDDDDDDESSIHTDRVASHRDAFTRFDARRRTSIQQHFAIICI